MSVLVLSDADVRRALDMRECIEAMDTALTALTRGSISMPLRFVVRPPADELFGLMPAHRGGDEPVFALKEIVVAPGNAARGLDPHQGLVVLHDGRTGEVRAILNASAVTEIRTAAVSALATMILARPGSRVVAVLGAGVQGRSHVEAMRAAIPDAEIRLWSRTRERASELAADLGVAVAATVREAVDGADVVCTVTSSREPVLERSWLVRGAHVNAVGACVPSARELDTATVVESTLIVDRRESALAEAGDVLLAAAEAGDAAGLIGAELGEVLVGEHPGRSSDDELTVFESLGVAAEDLAAAELAVQRARALGIGVEVPF